MDLKTKQEGKENAKRHRDKLSLLLADGETKYEKLFINPVGLRKRTIANTKPVVKRQIQDQFETPKPYRHGMDINSFGTDRDAILRDLNRNKELIKSNPVLIESFSKVKNANEFRKEFPVCIDHQSPIVKYYKNDVHSKLTAPGYSRNDYGRPYFS